MSNTASSDKVNQNPRSNLSKQPKKAINLLLPISVNHEKSELWQIIFLEK